MSIDAEAYMAGAIPSISRCGGSWLPTSPAPGIPNTPWSSPSTSGNGGNGGTGGTPWGGGPTPWTNPLWFPRTPFSMNHPVHRHHRHGTPLPRPGTRSATASTSDAASMGSMGSMGSPPGSSFRKSRSPTSPVTARPSPLRYSSYPAPSASVAGSAFASNPMKYGGWASPDPVRSAARSARSAAQEQVRSVAGSRIINTPQPSVGGHYQHGAHAPRYAGEGGSWERQSGSPKPMSREPHYPSRGEGYEGPYNPVRQAADSLPPGPPSRPLMHRRHTHDVSYPSFSGGSTMDLDPLRRALSDLPTPNHNKRSPPRNHQSTPPAAASRTKRDAPLGYIPPLSTEGYDRYAPHPAAATPGRVDLDPLSPRPTPTLGRSTSDPHFSLPRKRYVPPGLPKPTREVPWDRDGPALKTYGVAWKRIVGEGGLPDAPEGPRWIQSKPPGALVAD